MPTRQPSLSPDAARELRTGIGTAEAVAADLDVSVRSVYLYEKRGAPKWYRYALAGLKLEKAGLLK